MELLKYREGKISDGRIWLVDSELKNSYFQPGVSFGVEISEDNHEITVLPEGSRKVSHREDAPVIDIRNMRVKRALEYCDYITVEIYFDRIVVKGKKHTSTKKTEDVIQRKSKLKFTSFSFYCDDALYKKAGYESAGCLIDDDSVVYSVPIEHFDASILPKVDIWIVDASVDMYLRTLHLIRLFCQAEEKRPFVMIINPVVDVIVDFLHEEGYQHSIINDTSVFSVIGEVEPSEDLYQAIMEHLNTLNMLPVKPKLDLVSFYCGCISDVGFLDAGFNIKRAYDLNDDLAKDIIPSDFSSPEESYRTNIGDGFTGVDIFKLTSEDIPWTEVQFFSPSCHGMSKPNRVKGINGSVLENPKNRGVRDTIQKINDTQPLIFAIENVPEMLTIGDGIFLNEMQEILRGYHLAWRVIDAAQVGSPQHRKRAFVIGSRLGQVDFPSPNISTYLTVGEALDGVKDDMFNQQDVSVSKPESVERIRHIPPGGNWRDIPIELRTPGMGESKHNNVYRRLNPDMPSCTVVNVRKASILHPYEHRILTVRETARLMDLPDSYELKGSLAQMQQQLANGIPVNLVRYIANIIQEHYIKYCISA